MSGPRPSLRGLANLERAARRALERARDADTCAEASQEAMRIGALVGRAAGARKSYDARRGAAPKRADELLVSVAKLARRAKIRARWTCQAESGRAIADAISGSVLAYQEGRRVEITTRGEDRSDLLTVADRLVPLGQRKSDRGERWRSWRALVGRARRYAGGVQLVFFVVASDDPLKLRKVLDRSPPLRAGMRDREKRVDRESVIDMVRSGGVTASRWYKLGEANLLFLRGLRFAERVEEAGGIAAFQVNIVIGRRMQ